MSNKRLVLFCSVYPSDKGETFLHNEMEYLRAAFDEIIVVTDNSNVLEVKNGQEKILKYKKVKVSLLDTISLCNFFFLVEIVRNLFSFSLSKFKVSLNSYLNGLSYRNFIGNLIESNNIDCDETIFYSYWLNDSTYGLALYSNLRDIKFVSRVHGWDLYEERHIANYLPFRNVVGKRISRIYSISNNGISYLVKRYPRMRNVIELSRLGVKDYGKVNNDKHESDYKTIVSCSSVIPLKRVDMIAEALGELKDINVHWIHFGEGEGLKNLKLLANEVSGKNPNINIVLEGRTENSKIIEFYHNNRVDLFVNVSETEGLPVSIMEAMEAGIPILATGVGGTEEIVVNKENGVLIDPNISINKLSKKIEKLMKLVIEDQRRYSQKSRYIYMEKASADRNYNEFGKSLKELGYKS